MRRVSSSPADSGPAMSPLRRRLVDSRDLREMFNELRYWGLVKSGRWDTEVREDGHPSPESSGEPYCTRSQIVAYLDESGDQVALVHQYLRRDHSLGASGL